ncbi:hypothetical protein OAP56_00290 [Rickettsiaceae bacterium]|nr:hypothetical protein [Rickettsiaceae bacterium]
MKILENILKSKPDFTPISRRRSTCEDSYALYDKNGNAATPASPLSKIANIEPLAEAKTKIVSKEKPTIFKSKALGKYNIINTPPPQSQFIIKLNLFDRDGITAGAKIRTSGNICIIGGSGSASSALLDEIKNASLKQDIKLKEIDAKKFCALVLSSSKKNKPKNYIIHLDPSKEEAHIICRVMHYCDIQIIFQIDGVALNSELEGIRIKGSKQAQILQNLHGKNQRQNCHLVASLENEEFALMTKSNQCVRLLSRDFN